MAWAATSLVFVWLKNIGKKFQWTIPRKNICAFYYGQKNRHSYQRARSVFRIDLPGTLFYQEFLFYRRHALSRFLFISSAVKFDWHIDPIQLGSRLFQASEATDFPRMLVKISNKEWRDFFIHEAEKLKKQIIK